ncbi:hypothetical protein V8D89_009582, partial [Ganoderma adspersum]
MKFAAAALSATLVALAGGIAAQAQLSVLSPGGPNLWMVSESDNVVSWTCKTSPYPTFTVLIANSDVSVLATPQLFVAQQTNFDCSKLITKDQMNLKPATGYSIQLADPLNNTNVYAQSQPFEIKPFGSAYPASSATPTTAVATSTNTGSTSGSRSAAQASTSTSTRASTSAAPSGTGTTQGGNGAAGLFAPAGLAAAAFAALGVVF